MIKYAGKGKWEVVEWKNLHFRPPVLKDAIIGGGRASNLILIREKGIPDTTFAGYLLIKPKRPRVYRICGAGCVEHDVKIPSQIEWMEVPR